MLTTLNKYYLTRPSDADFERLLKHLGKYNPDDAPLPVLYILDTLGLEEAVRSLEHVEHFDMTIRIFAVWCAKQVEFINPDARVIRCNEVTVMFANGREPLAEVKKAGLEALSVAMNAATRAECYAALAAFNAAYPDRSWVAARSAALTAQEAEEELGRPAHMKRLQANKFREICSEL